MKQHTLLQDILNAWLQLKAQTPLVHCITNSVAANYAANVLLAAGASPAMIDNPFEAADFASIASGLSINLGTPTQEQVKAMYLAAQTRQQEQKTWVLDPVGYGAILKWRSEIVDDLLQYQPTVIRGNASEIASLAGAHGTAKGVDSTLASHDAVSHAAHLFKHCEVVAISGASDYILSNTHTIKVNGGSDLQPKVTASGCALGALIAAYCAVTTPLIASVAAHVHFAIAAKLAAAQHSSVGSFNVAFLDQLQMLDQDLITAHIDIEILQHSPLF